MSIDLVRVKLENGAEASVGASFAKTHGLKVLDKAAVRNRRSLPDKPKVTLAGRELDGALEAAGLSKSGSADEKRNRLADHQISTAPAVGSNESIPAGSDTSASNKEVTK